jgi:hypothetical protein
MKLVLRIKVKIDLGHWLLKTVRYGCRGEVLLGQGFLFEVLRKQSDRSTGGTFGRA